MSCMLSLATHPIWESILFQLSFFSSVEGPADPERPAPNVLLRGGLLDRARQTFLGSLSPAVRSPISRSSFFALNPVSLGLDLLCAHALPSVEPSPTPHPREPATYDTDAIFPSPQPKLNPGHRVSNHDSPPRPASVCQRCWEGPFSMHFGIPCASPRDGRLYRNWLKGIQYSTSCIELESRRETCVWCRFVYHWGKSYGESDFPEWIITVQGTPQEFGEDEDRRKQYQGFTVQFNGDRVFKGFVYTVPDDLAASYIKTRSTIRDVGSTRAMALARQHFDECVYGHEDCKRLTSFSPLLPTRLVDCADPNHPRLVLTTGRRGEYLALSYVWGEEKPYQTTLSSGVSIYEHRIDSSILPQTVRDAISVTHALGFKYLWVDTLCIIQDDDTDRRHEIGHMHYIYRYASLTIFAASASSASEGFLHNERPPQEGEVVLPFIFPPPPPNLLGLPNTCSTSQLQLGQVHLASIDSARTSYSDELGVMSTRAWCMQEYLMSPRALIFTPTRLLFSCRTTIQGVGNSFGSMDDEPQLPDILFLQEPPVAKPGSEEWKAMHGAWTKVVMDYSRRRATFESDKLVACAAVAQQFARVLNSEYLAGLWRSDTLLVDLLWMSDPKQAQKLGHRRPSSYRAPSWAWPAVEGAVCSQSRDSLEDFASFLHNIALAEIVSSQVTLEDPSLPFGRVTGGTLVLRGTPIPYRGGSAQKSGRNWDVFSPSFKHARRQNWGFGSYNWDEDDEGNSVDPGKHATVTLDCDADELPGRMWLVPFLRTTESYWSDNRVYGIVLELAPPSNSSGFKHARSEGTRFQRIGCFYALLRDSKRDPLWDPLTRAIENGDSRELMDIVVV